MCGIKYNKEWQLKYTKILSYSIIHNDIGFNDRVPVLGEHIFIASERSLSHAFNNFQQFLQKTSLTKCNCNAMVGSSIRIYVEISLNEMVVRIYPTKLYKLSRRIWKYKVTKEQDITSIRLKMWRASWGLRAFPRIAKSFV